MSDDHDGCLVGEFLLVPAYPGTPGPNAVKWLCVCVFGLSMKMLISDIGRR